MWAWATHGLLGLLPMSEDLTSGSLSCVNGCVTGASVEELNRSCYCLSVDAAALRRGLQEDLKQHHLSDEMITTHPHLFASVPMFVSRMHLERMAHVIEAVEAVVASTHFQDLALAWAPDIATFDPKSPRRRVGV
jgi:hypothetical protein